MGKVREWSNQQVETVGSWFDSVIAWFASVSYFHWAILAIIVYLGGRYWYAYKKGGAAAANTLANNYLLWAGLKASRATVAASVVLMWLAFHLRSLAHVTGLSRRAILHSPRAAGAIATLLVLLLLCLLGSC